MLAVSVILMLMPIMWIILSRYSQDVIVSDFMKSIGNQPVNLAFENLTVKMLQDNHKAVNIQSPYAQIHDLHFSKIDLQSPVITLKEKDQLQKSLLSDQGSYHRNTNKIILSRHIKIFDNQNYTIQANKMSVDLNNFKVTLPDGIHALYRKNSLKAKNVEFDQKSNKATFNGGVKLVIQPQNTL